MGNTKNAYGKPVYDDIYSFPQDSQDNADFTDEFANIRTGTSVERQNLVAGKQRPGMLFSEEDTGDLYRTDGAGGWSLIGDTGWVALILSTGWTGVSGHAPRGRRINGVIHLEGAVLRGAGGSLTNIATLPPVLQLASSKTTFANATIAARPSPAATAYAQLYINGAQQRLLVESYTNIDGTAGWVIPISCTFLRDQ